MSTAQPEIKCGLCGIDEAEHRELYGTRPGLLAFTFQPDTGAGVKGQVYLCRPCTHSVLPRRLLHAAGVPDATLAPEIWT